MLSSGLYSTQINMFTSYVIVSTFKIWRERLGHSGSVMMRKIVQNSSGHPLKNHMICNLMSFYVMHVLKENSQFGHRHLKLGMNRHYS